MGYYSSPRDCHAVDCVECRDCACQRWWVGTSYAPSIGCVGVCVCVGGCVGGAWERKNDITACIYTHMYATVNTLGCDFTYYLYMYIWRKKSVQPRRPIGGLLTYAI